MVDQLTSVSMFPSAGVAKNPPFFFFFFKHGCFSSFVHIHWLPSSQATTSLDLNIIGNIWDNVSEQLNKIYNKGLTGLSTFYR